MRDWKTTLPGVVAALALVVGTIWKVEIPQEVTNGIVAICLFILGLCAKQVGKDA